jgi:hypothetical protein
MAASIRNAMIPVLENCSVLVVDGVDGWYRECVERSPKGECRRTRRGSFQEGVTQESGCGRRRLTAEETGPTPA